MKTFLLISIGLLLLLFTNCIQPNKSQSVVTSDIDNFWMAYDKIVTTKDSAAQYTYLKNLFLDKGTPGLDGIMKARRYTAKSYIDAINQHPLFWKSIRENTYKAKTMASDLEAGIGKLEKLYPHLKPAKIYFTIGAFRTNGTTLEDMVLIGSELAMTDKNTVSSEFSNNYAHLKPFFETDPINNVVLLNIHEYVHTQQKNAGGYDLLSQCLYEGVAEFVSVTAMEQASSTPAIAYGQKHNEKVRARFEKEMFSPNWNDWLYNSFENEFQTRDLGYYVGYAICEKYYEAANDKKQAIKTLIELNYSDQTAIENFVEKTGYFTKSLSQLKEAFQQNKPSIVAIHPFENGDQNVDPNITTITVEFSEPMNKRFRGFEFGPLGEENVLRVKDFIGFSEDGKSVTLGIELKSNQHYQLMLSDRFRNLDGNPIASYLIDIKTK